MRCLLPLALALLPMMTSAQTPEHPITGIDWQLLAIDGSLTNAPASLRIESDGTMSGKAPCNRWSTMNAAFLPELRIEAIRATRMACDKLPEEQVFFDTLSGMTTVQAEGDSNLILTGPVGRSMEFVLDVANSQTVCKTCQTKGEAGERSP
ncbi:META domain-containing protein [Tabrizicola sp.]|uniref:META domain-containing protein n=1 Tax=Tabrizicola sp. TaxID=2005166 RepID=UPI0026016F53|nr:META domain-containing protein [Tabrizicola sp.]MDM7933447.1 META domain-containing protein [Tabrizicola sp.]